MRIRETIVLAGFLSIGAGLVAPGEAAAQTPVAPIAQRDSTWDTVTNVTMLINVGIVTLMPRVYYNDPEATVGWKARWHFSVLAPALAMTGFVMLNEYALKGAFKGTRPGCSPDNSGPQFPGSGCESFGMVSSQSLAAWGATGVGTSIFLVDTFKYSAGKFNAGGFIGNVALPVVLSVITSAGRAADPGGPLISPHETVPQIALGSVSGFVSGALLGLAYSMFQRPNCGYGGHMFCW